jgi:hypothetical protein
MTKYPINAALGARDNLSVWNICAKQNTYTPISLAPTNINIVSARKVKNIASTRRVSFLQVA